MATQVCIEFICGENVGIVYNVTLKGFALTGRSIRFNSLIAFGIGIFTEAISRAGTMDASFGKLTDAKSEALGNPEKTLKS